MVFALFLAFFTFFMDPSVVWANYEDIAAKYEGREPTQWSETVDGVFRRIDTKEKIVALTLDACGGPTGSGYDKELMDFLKKNDIKATLFFTGRWIKANPEIARELANDPLFEIEDHGMEHKPCSVNGKSIYGIVGTESPSQVISEIVDCASLIEGLGVKPSMYRSGTAYYDEIAVKIAGDLGFQVIGYSVLGDAGATFSEKVIVKQVLSSRPGDIILCHMNHPEKETAEGLIKAIPLLIKRGFEFVHLKGQSLSD